MLYPIKELQDIFVDACVRAPDGELVFASVYGRDGAVQQLYASLHLGVQEGGIRQLTLLDPDSSQPVAAVPIGDPRRLDKYSGRLPKDNLFGNLVHTWIYDESLLNPSKSSGSAWLLVDRETQAHDDTSMQARVWSLIEQLSPIPLLPHWRAPVLDAMSSQLVAHLGDTSYAPLGRIHASRVTLPDAFAKAISVFVSSGTLTLG